MTAGTVRDVRAAGSGRGGYVAELRGLLVDCGAGGVVPAADHPRADWDNLFDTVVISGEVGRRKPEPAIYTLAAERLGLPPEEIVFVDDLRPKVRGAAAVGVPHADVATTVDELEILLGLSLR